jgi:hypothetical protein
MAIAYAHTMPRRGPRFTAVTDLCGKRRDPDFTLYCFSPDTTDDSPNTSRCKYMEDKGFLFVGAGVSGGEEGARYGPSIMPGGSKAAWYVMAIFRRMVIPEQV